MTGHVPLPQIATAAIVEAPPLRAEAAASRAGAADVSAARLALSLALGSLILAGLFSLLCVVGRLPHVSEWIGDPRFFKRCLVVHVDLALVVWFFAFAGALFALLPSDRTQQRIFRVGFLMAVAGVVAMLAGTMIPGTAPLLSNYVPVIDNAVFVGGVALFFGGLLVSFLDGRLFVVQRSGCKTFSDDAPGSLRVTPDVAAGLKTVALAYLVAMLSFAGAWLATPAALSGKEYYELLFWGGGHVLQVANVAAMLCVWLLLLGSLLKRPVLSPRAAWLLFGLLLAPHLSSPLLTLGGTMTSTYRVGFTRLMQFGIFPVVTVVLIVCVRRLLAAVCCGELGRRTWRDPRFVGFAASASLTVAGFLLGSAIRSSTTLIPAHYHASIGAVTVAFMALTYGLLQPLGLPSVSGKWQRLIPIQLALFGFGQVVFAIGFAFGGAHGLGRKTYGAEQHIRSIGEYIGLGIMGAGGLLAIAGGLLFLLLVIRAGVMSWPFRHAGTALPAPGSRPLAHRINVLPAFPTKMITKDSL
jgi:cytochrome c oxidase subunit I